MTGPAGDRAAGRIEIADVVQGYAWAADSADPERQSRCFTEDGRLRFGDGAWTVGRGAIAALLGSHLDRLDRTCHQVAWPVVVFAGAGEATSRCTVTAWHRRVDGTDYVVHGWYEDGWRRTHEGWRMAERQLLVSGAVGRGEEGLRLAARGAGTPGTELEAPG